MEWACCTKGSRCVPAPANEFSKHSGKAEKTDANARHSHPCSVRVFRGIHAPELLFDGTEY